MYILDPATATPKLVIEHAIRFRGLPYRQRLTDLSAAHAEAADSMRDRLACRAARDLSAACDELLDILADSAHPADRADRIMRDMRLYISAFNAACEVLGLSRPVATEIMARHAAKADRRA